MDGDLDKFVNQFEQAAGSNLLSVILYGSAATGEFHARHSDLNLLCLFDKLDAQALGRLNPLTRRWVRKGHSAPLVFAASELARAADVFAIELMDIKASHKVLHGTDLVAAIEVPMTRHHLQVERELRQALVRLRERYLEGEDNHKSILALLTSSLSSLATLFRHAAIVLGAPVAGLEKPLQKSEAFDRLAEMVGFNPRPFHAVLEFRQGKTSASTVDAQALFSEILAAVSLVVDQVDRRLDQGR